MTDFTTLSDEQLQARVDHLRRLAHVVDASERVIADYERAQEELARRSAAKRMGHA